jgi:hypothetical protein
MAIALAATHLAENIKNLALTNPAFTAARHLKSGIVKFQQLHWRQTSNYTNKNPAFIVVAKHLACKYQKSSIPKFRQLHWRQHTFKNPVFTVAAKDLLKIHSSKLYPALPNCSNYPGGNTLGRHRMAWHGAASTFQKRKTLTLLQIEIKKEKCHMWHLQ